MDPDHTSSLLQEEIVYGPSKTESNPSLRQRLEIYYEWLGCWVLSLMFFGSPFLLIFLFIYFFFEPILWIFVIVHLLWMLYDRETPHRGSRRLKWLRKIRFWKCRRDFFPIKLVKTAELPPNTTYLFATFPHGVLVHGASTNFLSDVNHFDEAYPGLNPYVVTLNSNYYGPIARDIFLFLGCCAATPRSILHILNGPAGNVAVLVVGGTSEQKMNIPGTNRVLLKNRKGFVRMALKSGCSLVPVYSFGETYVYEEPTCNWYRRLREKRRASSDPNFFLMWGPCKLSHLFGFLPYQRPITTVVGKPIPVPKVEDPPSELVDKYHEIFVAEFVQLFETYKMKYDTKGENAILSIE